MSLKSEEEPLLRLEKLYTYLKIGKQVIPIVHDLSFELERGKTVAIIGESGSGKTLAAHSIMRIIPRPPLVGYEGNIFFLGEDLLEASETRMRAIRGKGIGLSFQQPKAAFDPVYTIGEQIVEGLRHHYSIEEHVASERAEENLLRLGLNDPKRVMKSYPHQLSGGMCQRAMIASCLALKPPLLIADEPTSALDVTTQIELLDLLRAIEREAKMAMILITHDLGVVAEIADEVLVMYATECIERGDVEGFFDAPLHPYSQGLFKARPLLRGKKLDFTPIPHSIPSPTDLPRGCRFHPRCPKAMNRCREESPPWFKAGEREVRCWLYDANGS